MVVTDPLAVVVVAEYLKEQDNREAEKKQAKS